MWLGFTCRVVFCKHACLIVIESFSGQLQITVNIVKLMSIFSLKSKVCRGLLFLISDVMRWHSFCVIIFLLLLGIFLFFKKEGG